MKKNHYDSSYYSFKQKVIWYVVALSWLDIAVNECLFACKSNSEQSRAYLKVQGESERGGCCTACKKGKC